MITLTSPIAYPSARKPYVLACLEVGPGALMIAQRASILARQLGARWEAAHVETPTAAHVPPARRETLLGAFRAAESLGGQTRTLNGDDPAAEILVYARREGVTHIVVGASSYPRWIEAMSGSIARTLIQNAGDIAIEVCAHPRKSARMILADAARPPPFGDISAYLASAGFVALATAIAVSVDRVLSLPNISLIYVLAVIAAAARYGAMAAGFAAIASALAYNFFLTAPYYSFEIADPNNVWAVFFFLLVGMAASAISAHARTQTLIARRQAEEASRLHALARDIADAEDEVEIAASAANAASKMLYARAVVMAPSQNELAAIAETPGPEMLGADDLAAAQWAYEKAQEAGHGSGALEGARWLFVPAPGQNGPVAVIGVRPFDDASRLDPAQRRLLDLVAAQTGVALDRARLQRATPNARGA